MGRVLLIELTKEQQAELESTIKNHTNHVVRQRSQMVLLKSKNYKTSQICEIVGIKSENQVNKWIRAYKSAYSTSGIDCLRNAKGQGRSFILDAKTERETIERVVKSERQKLEKAKVILEKELNKIFTVKTLKNFLKSLAGDINV